MERVYVVAVKGDNWVSRVIQWFTRSHYSHVFFCRHETGPVGDEYIAYESHFHTGVVRRRLLKADFGESCEWYECLLPTKERAEADKWLKSTVGAHYDWRGVAGFVTRRRKDDKQGWFCSEHVAEFFKRMGLPLHDRTQSWEVSPDMVVRSSWLKPTKEHDKAVIWQEVSKNWQS